MRYLKARFVVHWLFTRIAALGLIPTFALFNVVQQPHVMRTRIPIVNTATLIHRNESMMITKDDVDHEFDSFWIDIGGEG